jgi:hypothetical protein
MPNRSGYWLLVFVCSRLVLKGQSNKEKIVRVERFVEPLANRVANIGVANVA